jgi:hypothetical protein
VLGSDLNEDGCTSAVLPGPGAGKDSYRFAALSHESRNLRKSARVSLSAASSARDAHSAAFCRQYPIFSCMTVSTPSTALCAQAPGGSLETELAGCSITPNPKQGFKFQRVGRAKRSVPMVEIGMPGKTRGHGAKTPLPALRSILPTVLDHRHARLARETESAAARSILLGKRA